MKSPSPASDLEEVPQPLLAVEGEKKEADELPLPYPGCDTSSAAGKVDAFFKKSQPLKTADWRNVYKRAAFAASPASSTAGLFYSEKGKAAAGDNKYDFQERKSIKAEEGDAEFLIRNKSGFMSQVDPKSPLLMESAFAFKPNHTFSSISGGKGKQAMETLNKSEVQICSEKGKEEEESPKKETNENGGVEEEVKVWNLRPRVVKSKTNNANTGQQQLKTTKSEGVKKEKLSIAISLTKEEIEEDIFALTGAKPSRRPKKRPKNVQKQLDAVFPGLWLQSITSDSYKVSENSLKG
ncbi:hypothetical protein AAHA92_16856 [Salvia divinorum]|uniref:Uncharacterized protein n=1 Tax=Salvia divinorum TaxID=28513 RepID=A0ABD1H0C5_SALDI